MENPIEALSYGSEYWYFLKQTSYTLATAFIHRCVFECFTTYGDIAQTVSLRLNLFLYMLHQWDNFDCINSKYIIVLWQIPPDESTSYVFRNEVIFFLPIFRFPLLMYEDFSSTSLLNCYSVNAPGWLDSKYLEILLAAVTDVSFLSKNVRFLNFSLRDW